MAKAKSIKQALEERRAARRECSPDNLFDFSVGDLLKAGYKQLAGHYELLDGDVVQMDKAGALFCYTDSAKYLRKNLPKGFAEKMIVFRRS